MILDAAEQLFHERGVAETSTVDVAAAAKVSVGRLYYWFPDKDAVTNAVMKRSEQRLRDFLGKVIVHEPDVPTPDLLNRAVPLIGAFFREHPGSLAVLMRGPTDPVDHGRSMCTYFEQLAAAVVEARVSANAAKAAARRGRAKAAAAKRRRAPAAPASGVIDMP